MISIVPVRDGVLPLGTNDTIAECNGRVVVVGTGLDVVEPVGLASHIWLLELDDFDVAQWAHAIAATAGGLDDHVVLPHCPDGRDLAPALALELARPLLAGAVEASSTSIAFTRNAGRELHRYTVTNPFVATLQPGVRSPQRFDVAPTVEWLQRPVALSADAERPAANVVDVLPPDLATIDLGEADRIVGAGAGLDGPERLTQLEHFAAAIEATVGATRVLTDRGWIDHDRQIGTTGVVIDPQLYLSFGVSGAVQHTAGLGDPQHIISVNTDPHCPMMQMSDLAIVGDANATLTALGTHLGTLDTASSVLIDE